MLKLLYAHQFTYQISASSLNYFLGYEEGVQNPRWRRGCAHAPPSGKIFQPVEAPNHIYSRIKFPLSNSITSWDMESSICHRFNIGPRNGFLTLDLGFLVSSGFLGILANGFLRHCSFSPHSITSLLTTLNFITETAVVMIFILLLFHLFRTIYRIFIVALRSSWYVTTNKLPCETHEYLPNKL